MGALVTNSYLGLAAFCLAMVLHSLSSVSVGSSLFDTEKHACMLTKR